MSRLTITIAAILLLASSSACGGDRSLWHVSLETRPFGPVEFHIELDREADGLRGASLSGALALLRDLPGGQQIDDGLMEFTANRTENDSYIGEITAPWKKGTIELSIDANEFSGSIEGGLFAGPISGTRVTTAVSIRDYPAILAAFDAVVASRIFSPADLHRPAYAQFREQLGQIAAVATNDLDLLFGFDWSWQDDPFSHFELKRSRRRAEELFAFFDNYRVGFEAATVEFDDEIAILKVRTMMGADTIEQIVAAYARIAVEQPRALIIDLRGNGGGAFAVKPLVEHVIDEPVDAGYFLSQVWNRAHDRLPTTEEILAVTPWTGWSISAFWKSVQESAILRVQFHPATPNYDGPVFVLLDATSASATELAADAFRSSGITTIIGQPTAGQMLSQSMFDVADGFIVSLPVADYYSVENGRIEGTGVPVDIATAPDEAIDKARQLAREAIQ